MKRNISVRKICARVGLFGVAAATASTVYSGAASAAPHSPMSPNVTAPTAGNKLAGKTIFLDPGHQGKATVAQLHKQVNDGRGSTKNCQAVGATSIHKVPEHEVNWKVAQYLKQRLEAQGAKVVLSRQNDTSWGGCITDRAQAANNSGADVALSIHADASKQGVDNQHRGFHMIVPTFPISDPVVNKVQSTGGLAASKAVRDALVKAGFPISNYITTDSGLSSRFDVAGPALTKIPLAFVEMGNLSNPEDAKLLESSIGQQRYADGLTAGLENYLTGSQQQAAPQIPNTPNSNVPPQANDLLGTIQNLINGTASQGANLVSPGAGGTNPLGGNLDGISQQLKNIIGNNAGLSQALQSGDMAGLLNGLKNIPGAQQLLNTLQNNSGLAQPINNAPAIPGVPVFKPPSN